MDNWIQYFLLSLLLLGSSGLASAIAYPEAPPEEQPANDAEEAESAIYEPKVARKNFEEAALDTENIELGLKFGLLSIEDFEVNPVVGLTLNYHVLEDAFLSFNYAMSSAGETSYERLSGGASLLTDDERDYSYYNVSLGYDLFPGEVFLGSSYAFNSALYLLAGAGNTDFGGDTYFTINFGFGFRFIWTDWLALQVQVQDYVFSSSILGEEKLTNNVELATNITVFF